MLLGYPINRRADNADLKRVPSNQLMEFVVEKKLKITSNLGDGKNIKFCSRASQKGDFFLATDGKVYFVRFNERFLEYLRIKGSISDHISRLIVQLYHQKAFSTASHGNLEERSDKIIHTFCEGSSEDSHMNSESVDKFVFRNNE